jgi:peroxiredoxin
MSIKHLLLLIICLLSISSFSPKAPATHTPVTVYIFLSETCPICQSYTLTLKELYAKYNMLSVKFTGVFPNYYSGEKGLAAFKKKYAIPFDLVTDKNGMLSKRLKAAITPEVFVEDDSKNILYSGRIDDSFYAVGKRRTMITSNDLDAALGAITSGKKVMQPKTQAVGCIITTSK